MADDLLQEIAFRVGAHEGLKVGSESGRKGVDPVEEQSLFEISSMVLEGEKFKLLWLGARV